MIITEDEDCKVKSWVYINTHGWVFLANSLSVGLVAKGTPRIWEKRKICWSEAAATGVTIMWRLMLIFKIHAERCHYVTWQMHICSIQRDNVFPRFSSPIYIQRNSPFPLALYNSPTLTRPQTHTQYVCSEGIKNMFFPLLGLLQGRMTLSIKNNLSGMPWTKV